MTITHVALRYLKAFDNNEEFDGGLSFKTALSQSNLDGSRESLARIDTLLDQIQLRFKPDREEYFGNQAHVNFMYLLAFYVGRVVATETNSTIEWYQYDELLELMPDHRDFFPRCFASSVSCILSGGTSQGNFFVPISSIQERLFEEFPEKSVAFSATAFM